MTRRATHTPAFVVVASSRVKAIVVEQVKVFLIQVVWLGRLGDLLHILVGVSGKVVCFLKLVKNLCLQIGIAGPIIFISFPLLLRSGAISPVALDNISLVDLVGNVDVLLMVQRAILVRVQTLGLDIKTIK